MTCAQRADARATGYGSPAPLRTDTTITSPTGTATSTVMGTATNTDMDRATGTVVVTTTAE
ncbi:hypothetical protein [Allosaccharopolyspora coralli]|uniref:hypothetical protein n=1 Tax=Allosaccharopolyspora coralli TaxID=2665642 RepID=UPI001E3556D3|nr:hypothetical protein [Allosaccharopolyspora coralli]